jgi:RHS repeat-associated protein
VHDGIETLYLGDGVELRGGVYARYLKLRGRLVARMVGGRITWLYAGTLGSIWAEEDASGQVLRRDACLPYGTQLGGSTPEGSRFTGHEIDETGLVFMNARYHDPAIGQFLSPDPTIPSALPIGLNSYACAGGNPVSFVDPGGLGQKGPENRAGKQVPNGDAIYPAFSEEIIVYGQHLSHTVGTSIAPERGTCSCR